MMESQENPQTPRQNEIIFREYREKLRLIGKFAEKECEARVAAKLLRPGAMFYNSQYDLSEDSGPAKLYGLQYAHNIDGTTAKTSLVRNLATGKGNISSRGFRVELIANLDLASGEAASFTARFTPYVGGEPEEDRIENIVFSDTPQQSESEISITSEFAKELNTTLQDLNDISERLCILKPSLLEN